MPEFFPPMWSGTLREHYLLLFGVASTFGLTAAMIGAWIGSYLAGRRATERALREAAAVPLQYQRDLVQLHDAIEAITLEVERVAEGQRYLTRVISERGDARSELPQGVSRIPSRIITPH